jgi:predicted RNase H-like HicB family nuclease
MSKRSAKSVATKTKRVSRPASSALSRGGHPPFTLRVVIHPAEEGGYWAEVPGFPGCVSEGDTLEEVRANIREAFTGVFAVMQEDPPSAPGLTEEIPL